MNADPIIVVPYDADWPGQFESERVRLHEVLRECGPTILHVGSTAVPGLAAKPIIDIMIGVRALSDIGERISAIEALGYEYVPEFEDQLPERRYFRRPREHPRTHHIHAVLRGSDFWSSHLVFRNYLREHPETAQEYAALKGGLAQTHRNDRAAYTEAKSPFIDSVLERASKERKT